MTCDTSMLHGRGVSFALAEAELVWREILEDAVGGELRPVYGAEGRWQQELEAPVVVPPGRQRPAPLRHPDARAVPGPRVSVHVQLLLGDQDRRAADSQPEHRHHPGQPPRRQGGWCADRSCSHPTTSTSTPRPKGCFRPWSRSASGWSSSSSAIRRSQDRSAWWRFWPRPGASRCSSASSRLTARPLLAARKGQNRPEMYRDIVRLCREHGISSHFSNIIGFPQDTERDVDQHLEMLRELGPTFASFYILCPIPGTEQYDEFVAEGPDHGGQPRPVRHDVPDMAPPPLLARAVGRVAVSVLSQVLLDGPRRAQLDAPELAQEVVCWRSRLGITAMSLFNRYCTWRRTHPMSGGVMRVRRDRVDDFLSLRKEVFGFELVPLPRSLQLSAADSLLNRVINPHVRASLPRATSPSPRRLDLK